MKKDIIKVLVWQRRVGKSYILFQIMDELKNKFSVKDNEICYINKELNQFDFIRNYQDLLDYVKKDKNKKYIFIDEIQDIENFEKALRDLQAMWDYDIYISGSNAKLLSSEIATYLTWRYVEFEIFPLNYSEFLDFHNFENNQESFFKYVKFGGLPYLINLPLEEEVVYDYLTSVYNTILLKDIVRRYSIRNVDFLDRLIVYLADNVWNLFTARNISQYLKSQKIDLNPNVILNYLNYITSVFLVNKVRRKDVVWKKIFEINDKFYFSDVGIRNAIVGGFKQLDIWKVLENIVFVHFKSLWYKVYVGKYKDKEIDFVVEKKGDIKYIQVAYLLADEKTIDREFWNLLAIPDNYEKIVLSADNFFGGDYKWIKHYNIWEYLWNLTG